MPLSDANKQSLFEDGFKNVEPFSASTCPLLAQKLLEFSRIIGVKAPAVYVADYVGPPHIERLNISVPLLNMGQFSGGIIISRSCFQAFTPEEVVAGMGHELVHLYEDHIDRIVRKTFWNSFAGGVIAVGGTYWAMRPPQSDETDKPQSSRRSFLRDACRAIVPIASFGVVGGTVGSLSMRGISETHEFQASLVSAELFGTGKDLISALKKMGANSQKITDELSQRGIKIETPIIKQYMKQTLYYHPSNAERIAELVKLDKPVKAPSLGR